MSSNSGQYYNTPSSHGSYRESLSADQRLYHQSLPVSRYCRSEGSAPALSPPTSPMPREAYYSSSLPSTSHPGSWMMGNSPGYSPGRDTNASAEHSEDPQAESSHSGRDYPVCCLHAGCNVKPFKRRADLDRHYKHRHAPESQKEAYKCDYPRCVRRLEPFHRRDHFRDHLREFHKEDIEKRGGVVNEEWLDNRYQSPSWWRCPKCLARVRIERSGYECPNCRTACQVKRKEARRRD